MGMTVGPGQCRAPAAKRALAHPPWTAGVHMMVRYRIYPHDAEGRIMSHADADCASDREACVLAKNLIKPGEQAEVWHDARRVQLIGLSKGTERPRFMN